MLLSGCGGGGSSATPTDNTSTEKTAYLIDSAVEGIDYTCGTLTGTTDTTGKFTYDSTKCPTGVEFKLGSLSLGTIIPSAINTDTYLTIQELAGTTRDNITDGNVTKLAVLLQSLNDYSNPNDGILITQTIKNAITLTGNIKDRNDSEISAQIQARGKTEKDANDALAHLLQTATAKGITIASSFSPTDFTIANKTGMALGSQAVSDTITIAGLTIPTYITITNGEYSLDGGTTWKSTKSLVSNGQTVKVRHTTANSPSGTTTTTLKIGGVTKTFGSITDSIYKVGNIVTDTSTGLMWQDNSGVTLQAYNWNDSFAYCDNLILDNYMDWRIPTFTELRSIVDANNSPAIKSEFENSTAYYYWSSTIAYTGAKSTIYFDDGHTGSAETWLGGYIRCVRGGN